jgi:hypothetical protein
VSSFFKLSCFFPAPGMSIFCLPRPDPLSINRYGNAPLAS